MDKSLRRHPAGQIDGISKKVYWIRWNDRKESDRIPETSYEFTAAFGLIVRKGRCYIALDSGGTLYGKRGLEPQ
jgi:hypothetical protein